MSRHRSSSFNVDTHERKALISVIKPQSRKRIRIIKGEKKVQKIMEYKFMMFFKKCNYD